MTPSEATPEEIKQAVVNVLKAHFFDNDGVNIDGDVITIDSNFGEVDALVNSGYAQKVERESLDKLLSTAKGNVKHSKLIMHDYHKQPDQYEIIGGVEEGIAALKELSELRIREIKEELFPNIEEPVKQAKSELDDLINALGGVSKAASADAKQLQNKLDQMSDLETFLSPDTPGKAGS